MLKCCSRRIYDTSAHLRRQEPHKGNILHDFCHSHASIALRQGATVLAIGRLLGHADPQTTLKYTHPADSMIADAAEIVGAVLEG